jgi:hypothetical protein
MVSKITIFLSKDKYISTSPYIMNKKDKSAPLNKYKDSYTLTLHYLKRYLGAISTPKKTHY